MCVAIIRNKGQTMWRKQARTEKGITDSLCCPPETNTALEINHKPVRFFFFKKDYPGGPIVKNLPANARDIRLIPSPGRFHIPQSSQAQASQWVSPHSRAHALQQEEPVQWEAHARKPLDKNFVFINYKNMIGKRGNALVSVEAWGLNPVCWVDPPSPLPLIPPQGPE